jgi:hypothetical protein
MAALATTFPLLAVSSIYCLWRAYLVDRLRRERTLRRRVAYMLWVAAGQIEVD